MYIKKSRGRQLVVHIGPAVSDAAKDIGGFPYFLCFIFMTETKFPMSIIVWS